MQSNYPDSLSVVTFSDCEILSFDADQMICLTGKVKHLIDLRACAEEFLKKHPTSSGRCIGERHAAEGYFLLFTPVKRTKIVFKRGFYLKCRLLRGCSRTRFRQFQHLIEKAGFSTVDLS